MEFSFRVEHGLRMINKGNRGTYCGIADIDYVDSHPLVAIGLYYGLLFDKTDDKEIKKHISDIFSIISVVFSNKSIYELNDNDENFRWIITEKSMDIRTIDDFLELILKDMINCYNKVFGANKCILF